MKFLLVLVRSSRCTRLKMTPRLAMSVVVFLMFFVEYGESTRPGVVANSSSHHGAPSLLSHHEGAKGVRKLHFTFNSLCDYVDSRSFAKLE